SAPVSPSPNRSSRSPTSSNLENVIMIAGSSSESDNAMVWFLWQISKKAFGSGCARVRAISLRP
ncbi:hypothetical protein HAX54_003785, partial [Datura stramonium]|nr:hypothetical protein [Datura stramonium]